MTKNRSKLLLAAAFALTFSPAIAIVSCANSADQTSKLSLKATEIQLNNVGQENAQVYSDPEKLRTLIFNQKETIFNGDLTSFNISDILVSEIEANSLQSGTGTLKVLLEVKKANQTLLSPTRVVFRGFNVTVFAFKGSEINLDQQDQVDPKQYKTSDTFQTLIFQAKEQIFNNLPQDLTAKQIVVKSTTIKIRSGALIATVKVENKMPDAPDLISDTEIKLIGFKTISAFKNNVINLTNVNNQAANMLANEASLQQLILNKAAEIFVNLPADPLTAEQVAIADDSIKVNGSTLKVDLAIKNKNDDTLLIEQETITLTGFKAAIELKVAEINLVLDKGEDAFVNYVLTPGQLNNEKLKNLIFRNRNQIFANLPNDFNLNSFEIIYSTTNQVKWDRIITKIRVPGPNGQADLISETQLVLSGFFAPIDLGINGIKLKLNDGEESFYKYFNLDNGTSNAQQNALMEQLIFDHATEIFANVPADFSINYIKVKSIRPRTVDTLEAIFSVSRTPGANDLFKEANINFSGFFNSVQSKVKLALSENEKPKAQYLNGTDEAKAKLVDLIFKYRNEIFINLPNNFAKDWIKILQVVNNSETGEDVLEIMFKLTKNNQDIFPESPMLLAGFI